MRGIARCEAALTHQTARGKALHGVHANSACHNFIGGGWRIAEVF